MENSQKDLLTEAKHNLAIAKEQLEKFRDNPNVGEETQELFRQNYENALTNLKMVTDEGSSSAQQPVAQLGSLVAHTADGRDVVALDQSGAQSTVAVMASSAPSSAVVPSSTAEASSATLKSASAAEGDDSVGMTRRQYRELHKKKH